MHADAGLSWKTRSIDGAQSWEIVGTKISELADHAKPRGGTTGWKKQSEAELKTGQKFLGLIKNQPGNATITLWIRSARSAEAYFS